MILGVVHVAKKRKERVIKLAKELWKDKIEQMSDQEFVNFLKMNSPCENKSKKGFDILRK